MIRGAARLDGVSVGLGDRRMVDDLRGVVGIGPDAITLDSLTGTFADGPFEVSGAVGRAVRTVSLVVHAQPDLDALDRLELVPAGVTLSGNAELAVSVAGDLDAIDSMGVVGTVVLSGVQAKHPRLGVPLYVPAGELTLAGREVSWTEADMLIGEDRVLTSGHVLDLLTLSDASTVAPQIDVSVRGSRLDLGALLPPDEGELGIPYVRAALANLGGRRIDGRTASAVVSDRGLSRPERLPARGSIQLGIDTLSYGVYHLADLRALIELADSSLIVAADSFQVWGGIASGRLALGLGSGDETPFALSLTTDGVAVEELMATAIDIREGVTGLLGLELEAKGLLDRGLLPADGGLSGSVSVSLRDGRIQDTPPNLVIADFLGTDEWADVGFDQWDTELAIVDRTVEVASSDLTGPDGHVSAHGMVDFDGTQDLAVGLSIPPDRLSAVSLRRTGIGQSVLDHLSAAGSSLDIGLRMSGRLAAPVLEPDASNAVALVR